MVPRLKDGRVVYGARCSWWDSISEASTVGAVRGGDSRIPCCPHCGGVLLEVPDAREWWEGAQRYEDDGHPGYVAFLRWDKGKCFPDLKAALAAFAEVVAVEAEIAEAVDGE